MKQKSASENLTTLFNRTHNNFQNKIKAIASVSGLLTVEVYSLWRAYCERCSDQSALLWEFVRWYKDELGGNVEALDKALENPEVYA